MLLEGGYAFSWDEVSTEDIIKFSHWRESQQHQLLCISAEPRVHTSYELTQLRRVWSQTKGRTQVWYVFSYAAHDISYHTRAVQSMLIPNVSITGWNPDLNTPPFTFTTICICYHKTGIASRLSDSWSVPVFCNRCAAGLTTITAICYFQRLKQLIWHFTRFSWEDQISLSLDWLSISRCSTTAKPNGSQI